MKKLYFIKINVVKKRKKHGLRYCLLSKYILRGKMI